MRHVRSGVANSMQSLRWGGGGGGGGGGGLAQTEKIQSVDTLMLIIHLLQIYSIINNNQ